MDVTLQVYRTSTGHKLTVVARPAKAASLGEHILVEGQVLDLPDDPTAIQALREAYQEVARLVGRRTGVVAS